MTKDELKDILAIFRCSGVQTRGSCAREVFLVAYILLLHKYEVFEIEHTQIDSNSGEILLIPGKDITDGYKYVCQWCGKEFKDESEYNAHED